MDKGFVQDGAAGKYLIEDELGAGGFGTTYRATRQADGRPVVVKYLNMDRVPDWKAVELFDREAQVLQQLSHARIPSYIDHGPQGEQAPSAQAPMFVVQAYVDGAPLSRKMHEHGRFEDVWAAQVLRDVLDILDYLHGKTPPVIHRDLKPDNILIDASGHAHLIDFGAVRAALEETGTTTAGTFGYAAPEQFVGRATARSDLYGLGMTIVAALTGKEPEALPFRGNRLDIDEAIPTGAIDARLKNALRQMIEPDPDDRPQSAAQVLRMLAPRAADNATALERVEVNLPAVKPWYDALYRRDRRTALAVLPERMEYPIIRGRFDRSGQWMVAQGMRRTDLVRLRDLEVFPLTVSHGETFFGFDPTGDTLVALDRVRGIIGVYDLSGGQPTPPREAATSVFEGDFSSFGVGVSVGPQGQIVAAWSEFERDAVRLLNPQGAITQTLRCADIQNVAFTPDGGAVVVATIYDLNIYGHDGSHRFVEATRAAFSPDGRHEAIVGKEEVSIRRVQGAYLSEDNEEVAALPHHLANMIDWTPDGRHLLLGEFVRNMDGHLLTLVRAEDGERITTVKDFGKPVPMAHIQDAAVAQDGRTIWVAGVAYWRRTTSEQLPGVGSANLRTGEGLGTYRHFVTLAKYEDVPERVGADPRPMFLTEDGFGWADPPVEGFPNHEAARQIMRGVAPTLTDAEAGGWMDRQLTMRFLDGLFAHQMLPIEADPALLVSEAQTLTHLLPAMVLRAQQMQGVRFGPDQGGNQLSVDKLVAASRAIADMGEGERHIVFEDMIAALRQRPLYDPARRLPEPITAQADAAPDSTQIAERSEDAPRAHALASADEPSGLINTLLTFTVIVLCVLGLAAVVLDTLGML